MYPTPWNGITSFSWTWRLLCETGVRDDAQGFGVGKCCCKLDMEMGVTLCAETCSGNVAQASLHLIPSASAFVCWDGRDVVAHIFVGFLF